MKSTNADLLNPEEAASEFLTTLTYALDHLNPMAGVPDTKGNCADFERKGDS